MDTLRQVGTSVVEHGTNGAGPAANEDRKPPPCRLIDRLRAGDATARTALVRRYHSALVSQASRILRDRELAEDAVQDAWVAAFACIHGFVARSSLFAWLLRIVINRARHLRRREVRSLPFSACRPPGSAADEELQLTADEASPERLLLEREALGRLNEALRALPESQRTVLLLRDFAGASPAETCGVLGINDLAQRVRLSRARASIRKALCPPGGMHEHCAA